LCADKEECALLVKQLVKIKLILSVNAGGDSDAETYQVNDAFANKRFSINLNAAQLKLAVRPLCARYIEATAHSQAPLYRKEKAIRPGKARSRVAATRYESP
jgi:hypothetical protein